MPNAAAPAPEGSDRSIPLHVAIIMDGNGRWAESRGLPRSDGHRAGMETVRSTVRAARELGVRWLTLYAFSSENWNRPKEEVDTLMKYLDRYLRNEIGELQKNNVRLEVIGGQELDRMGCHHRELQLRGQRDCGAHMRLADRQAGALQFDVERPREEFGQP